MPEASRSLARSLAARGRPARPIVRPGGGSRQLVAHSRGPMPARPGAPGPRVRPQRRGRRARVLRAAAVRAPRASGPHEDPRGPGRDSVMALGRRVPAGRAHGPSLGQPERALHGVPLRGVPAGGGRAVGLPLRGLSHAQARELAGHGGDWGRLPRASWPSRPRRRHRRGGAGGEGLGERSQRMRPDGRLEARGR